MSRSPRRASAPHAPETAVEQAAYRADPGSYERQADGSHRRTDDPTRPAPDDNPGGPVMSLDSARATAAALAELGAEIPPSVRAVLAEAGEAPPPEPAPEPATASDDAAAPQTPE